MNAEFRRIKEIFLAAVEKPDPAERDAYLREACGQDEELRRHVDALLGKHAQAGSFLESPAPSPVATVDEPPDGEAPGTVIGPYKLIEQIGEGGMGTVWMAQQTEPVKRLVAVKLIKAGMDSRQVIARFEAERQALALMDHPNIAKVLDGGTTPSGRPYFVMDLVKGVPITRYCDEHHLTPPQRLELFIPVCQAVQHAHQKGIIHRDLKPSNVLVALYDGKPVPKVIDFGVAKAAGQSLTDKTLVTGFGNIVGTLEYMSPEQAETNQLDIDTRSDIYCLGVLLYELLAGSPPFTRKELEKAGMLEMLRVIREQEPSKPSTKLSTAESLPTLAANRGTEPAKLTRLVRGELDWIVMKALEKDRSRRYETANGFAMDVQRYLADEAVLACPPSLAYRLRKFARRNKGGLAVAALVLFFLVLLGSGAGWAWRDRAVREAEEIRQQAEREAESARQKEGRQAKVAAQVEAILPEVDRLENEQKWPEALAAARRAAAAAAGGEADPTTAERVRQRLKDLEFIDRLEQLRMQDRANDFKRDRDYARAFRDYGVDVDELAVEPSIERLKARPVLVLPIAVALDEWLPIRRGVAEGDDASWKRLVSIAHGIDPEPLRDRLRSIPWPAPPEARDELRRLAESIEVRAHHPATLYRLAGTLERVSPAAALRILREAQAVYPGDYWLNYRLGLALENKWPTNGQHFEAAIRFHTVAVALRPSTDSYVHTRIGSLLARKGDLAQAIVVYRRGTELFPKSEYAPYSNLGWALRRQGKPDEAIAVYRKAIENRPDAAGEYWAAIGDTRRDQKKLDEAADAYRKAIDAHRQAIEARPERASDHIYAIGEILRRQGKPDEAVAVYREAIDAGSKAADEYGFALGGALRAQGKPDEAVAAYRKFLENRPDAADVPLWLSRRWPNIAFSHVRFWRAIGDTRIAQGKSDEAVAAYRKAIDVHVAACRQATEAGKTGYDPALGPVQDIGTGLRVQGKPDEAVAVYRHGIDAVPKAADAYWHAIGDTRREQKKLDEAADAYRKASELMPNAPGHHHSLALALRERNEPAEANAAFDRAIELYRRAPDLTSAERSWNVGVVLRDKGELDEAIGAFRQALERAPTYGPVIRDLVAALRARGRSAEALDVYRKAFQADPTDFEYLTDFGNALLQHGKLDEAVAFFRKAIEVASESKTNFAGAAYAFLGQALHRQNKGAEAIAAYYRAIELDPEHFGSAYINIGQILRGWGRLDEAIAYFKKVPEISPKNAAAAHFEIGESLFQQNKLDRAVAALRKAIELQPNKSPRSHRSLAWILATRPEAKQRDPKEAVALARRAVEQEPSEMSWQYLGWIHYRTGDWKASIEALEKSCKVQAGGTGDSGQWIVLALAHARLAAQEGLPEKEREHHKVEARRRYEEANKIIDQLWRDRPTSDHVSQAIWDFRSEARALIGVKESKK